MEAIHSLFEFIKDQVTDLAASFKANRGFHNSNLGCILFQVERVWYV
jgi:hypothetical protein